MTQSKLISLLTEFKLLGIDKQIDYDKFHLYSMITHSTAIEGSTVTEIENQLLFDEGISAKGRSMAEQLMNVDLKAAYDESISYANKGLDLSVEMLKKLSAMVMKNTGTTYNTMLGEFSSANGDLRLLNVTAGVGGRSYMNYAKVPQKLEEFCKAINERRKSINRNDIIECYKLSFDVHYLLVTIHPWADGNGRMSRLVMNQVQFELGIFPTIIHKDHKVEYIEALVATREQEDIEIFRKFMFEEHCRNIEGAIAKYKATIESESDPFNLIRNSDDGLNRANDGLNDGLKLTPRAEQIASMIANNPTINVDDIAQAIGVSKPTAEREISALRKGGIIGREGSKKSGRWVISDKAKI
ncbi:MAG: Fic family protein [Rikenellaceae bacterium]